MKSKKPIAYMMPLSKIKGGIQMVNYYVTADHAQTTLPATTGPKFFAFGTPNYTNLGDQAVSLAQRRYIEQEFPAYTYIEILEEDNEAAIKAVQAVIQPQDIVSYVGGGNMGNLYLDHEQARRRVFETFTENLTISFPQSIHFEDTPEGKKEQALSQAAYRQNPNLYLVARDAQSYHRMQYTFHDNHVLFTPDMVLYFEHHFPTAQRSGALFVLRHDGERVIDEHLVTELEHRLGQNRPHERTDTVLDSVDRITPVNREQLFRQELDLFSQQEIVITDRWHGMVFCALTGTPCLLFGNSYGKGKHAYVDWLEHLDWIDYTDETEPERLMPEIERLMATAPHDFSVRRDFKQLHQVILTYSEKHQH